MSARRNPRLVGRYFVVRSEGGDWDFVDKDEWDHTGAQIRGERSPDGHMQIWDGIIKMERTSHISDQDLLEDGYILPAWVCGSCAHSAQVRPKFCPECGTVTVSGIE
jgi:hypothetical protein